MPKSIVQTTSDIICVMRTVSASDRKDCIFLSCLVPFMALAFGCGDSPSGNASPDGATDANGDGGHDAAPLSDGSIHDTEIVQTDTTADADRPGRDADITPIPEVGTFEFVAIPGSELITMNGSSADTFSSPVMPSYVADPPVRYLTSPGGNPASIVNAWSGAAYDYSTDTMFVNGGGHADYCGNGVYAFDVASGSWHVVQLPSRDFSGYTVSDPLRMMPDGSRPSVHSYAGMVFLPSGQIAFMGGSLCSGAGTVDQSRWLFDTTGDRPQRWTNLVVDAATGSGLGVYMFYSGRTETVYAFSGGFLHSMDTATGELTRISPRSSAPTPGWSDSYGCAYDDTRHLVLCVGQQSGQPHDLNSPVMRIHDIESGTFTIRTPSTLNDPAEPFPNCDAPGVDFVPEFDAYGVWCGGTTLYLIDAEEFGIHAHSIGGLTDVEKTPNGMFGRFRWSRHLDRFVVLHSATDSVKYIVHTPPSE